MPQAHTFTMICNTTMARIENSNAQIVFYWLCSFRNQISDLCCPSISTLSKKARLSKSSILRALKYLIDQGLLETNGGFGQRNKYRIKDNKNKALKAKQCPIDTGAIQTPTGVSQTPAIRSINYTNNKTTTTTIQDNNNFYSYLQMVK